MDPLTTDLPWCGAVLRQNGVVEETGLAAGVQGHPAVGIAWLANKLAPWGEYLQAGEIVLAGSFTKPAPAKVGDVFDADYGPLGQAGVPFCLTPECYRTASLGRVGWAWRSCRVPS